MHTTDLSTRAPTAAAGVSVYVIYIYYIKYYKPTSRHELPPPPVAALLVVQHVVQVRHYIYIYIMYIYNVTIYI